MPFWNRLRLWTVVVRDEYCEEPYRNLLENEKLESYLCSTISQVYPSVKILVTNQPAESPASLKFVFLEQWWTVNKQVQDKGQMERKMFYVCSVYFTQDLL
jgi:hypothetical protein